MGRLRTRNRDRKVLMKRARALMAGLIAASFVACDKDRASRCPSDRTGGRSEAEVTEAYEQLVAEGYLRSGRGAGTWVGASSAFVGGSMFKRRESPA